MIRLCLIVMLVIILYFLVLLIPIAIWFALKALLKKIEPIKPWSGPIAALIIVLPTLFEIYGCFKGRSGDEIYQAVFKASRPDCVKIISFKDARLPVIDNDIRLHFRVCPEEMKRILCLQRFEKDILATAFHSLPGDSSPAALQAMGDSVYRFSVQHNGGATEIYMRFDSSEAYYWDADF